MTNERLGGKRVVVVGASSGIGRAFAVHAVREGARTVLVARRADRLDEATSEAGDGYAVAGDVTDPDECERIIAEAAAVLGHFDLLLYCVGVAPLRRLATTTATDWRAVFDANVVGAHQIVRAAMPYLPAAAIVACVSSETVGQPRTALGVYNASKAALEESLKVWRAEHPEIRFSCVSVGATFPTEFGSAFDPELLVASLDDWTRRGLMQEDYMNTDELAGLLVETFAGALDRTGIGVEYIALRAASPVVGTATSANGGTLPG
jgi:NAD(P)-dependent dehydrogenase (short-subunit alcohol dehydrogenase family)